VQDREGVTLGSHSRFVRLATGRWLRPSNSMLRVGFRTPHWMDPPYRAGATPAV